MKKENKLVILLILIVLVIGGFLIYRYLKSNKYDWKETYSTSSNEPYGMSLFKTLLEETNKVKEVKRAMRYANLDTVNTNSVYLFIHHETHYDEASFAALLKFIRNGNQAFISTNYINFVPLINYKSREEQYDSTDISIDSLKEDKAKEEFFSQSFAIDTLSCLTFKEKNDSIIQVNFWDEEMAFPAPINYDYYARMYRLEWFNTNWSYIDYTNCETTIKPISYMETDSGKVHQCVQMQIGKGRLYVHSQPLQFTNYHLLTEEKFNYINRLLSFFPKNANIIWDKFSHRPPYFQPHVDRDTPLKFILKEPALQSAWYLLLLTALLYFIFFIKRKQREIPVLAPLKNSSIEFTETIGQLYFQNRDNKMLSKLKMKLFLAFVRSNYQLSTKKLDKSFIHKLARKAHLSTKEVAGIFRLYQKIKESDQVYDDTLILFHQKIEYFYQHCK